MKAQTSMSRTSFAMPRCAVATFACALLLGCITPTRLVAGEAQADQKASDTQPPATDRKSFRCIDLDALKFVFDRLATVRD
jgi:hypothetical protein